MQHRRRDGCLRMNLKKDAVTKRPEESGHSNLRRSRTDRSGAASYPADETSESLTQQGVRSAESLLNTLLVLVAQSHLAT
jgi:hypothetical protein